MRIAAASGCSVIGIDAHEDAIAAANLLVTERRMSNQAQFFAGDATEPLPFSDCRFDAITCIDAINHFPERPRILADWTRVLKPGGRLLFTDPITVTGPLTNAEVTVRSAAGFYLFVPPGYDERVIEQCGLKLLISEDRTASMAQVAESRRKARKLRRVELCEVEGAPAYEQQQEFLAVAARLAKEGRLCRFVYVAQKFS